MCGLVGMAGNVVEQDKKAFNLLLRLDVVRGWDSTGVAVIDRANGNINLYKHIGPPEYLYGQEEHFDARGMYKGPAGKVFIGHNRAATKGKVTDENAHPFVHDGIVGAHNGTLTSVSKLEDGYKFEVDSEAIFYNLSLYEPKSVIANVWGAYALTWYDDGTDKLYIVRNGERPLWYCRRNDKDVIYWASEKWMLERALSACRIMHGEIKMFDMDTLYTLDVSSVNPSDFRKIDWEVEKDVKGYTPPPPAKRQYHGGQAKNNVVPFVGGTTSSAGKITNTDKTMMNMLVDTEIRFRFGGVKMGVAKQQYIYAYPDNPNLGYEIRIYGDTHVNWNVWSKKLHHTVFKGRIKRLVDNCLTAKRELYFLIDLRSLREEGVVPLESTKEAEEKKTPSFVDDVNDLFQNMMRGVDDTNDPTIYEGFQGRFLTKHEWQKATHKGCAGCGGEASANDMDLVFIDHDEFLCGVGGCNETYADHIPESVQKYLLS